MKTVLLSAIMALAAQSVLADDFKYLTVYDKDGKATDIELATLKKITFTGTDMVAETEAGEQAFALTTLGKMVFAQQATAIKDIKVATKGTIQYADGSLSVGPEAKGTDLIVYAAGGTVVARTTVGDNGASINLNTLAKGIYVVRVGKTAIKISK